MRSTSSNIEDHLIPNNKNNFSIPPNRLQENNLCIQLIFFLLKALFLAVMKRQVIILPYFDKRPAVRRQEAHRIADAIVPEQQHIDTLHVRPIIQNVINLNHSNQAYVKMKISPVAATDFLQTL